MSSKKDKRDTLLHGLSSLALIRASGYFLTEEFPENWEKMTVAELRTFVSSHRNKHTKDAPVNVVLRLIQDLAYLLMAFLYESSQLLSKDPDISDFANKFVVNFSKDKNE